MEINKDTILRAWRDEEFAKSLPADAREAIPERPTRKDGSELSDSELEQAAGGTLPALAAAGIVGGSGVAGYGVGELLD